MVETKGDGQPGGIVQSPNITGSNIVELRYAAENGQQMVLLSIAIFRKKHSHNVDLVVVRRGIRKGKPKKNKD